MRVLNLAEQFEVSGGDVAAIGDAVSSVENPSGTPPGQVSVIFNLSAYFSISWLEIDLTVHQGNILSGTDGNNNGIPDNIEDFWTYVTDTWDPS